MSKKVDVQRHIPLTIKQMKAFCDEFGLKGHKKIRKRDEMEAYFWKHCVVPLQKEREKSQRKSQRANKKVTNKNVSEPKEKKKSFKEDTKDLKNYNDVLKYLRKEGHKVKSVLDLVDLTTSEINQLIKKTKKYNTSGVPLEDVIKAKTARMRSKQKIKEKKVELLLEALANNFCSGIKRVMDNQKFDENRATAIVRSSIFNKRGYRIYNFRCKGSQPLLLPKKGEFIVLTRQ